MEDGQMGILGPGIEDDDLAMDIVADFRGHIGDGLSPEEAVGKLISDYDPDPEDEVVFWLSVAHVQVKTGRLTPQVKEQALSIINAGGGVEEWRQDARGRSLASKRSKALLKLKKSIEGPQRSPTKIRKRFRDKIEWEVGDVLAYQLLSGRWTAFRLCGIHHCNNGDEGVYELLNVHTEAVPTQESVRSAGYMPSKVPSRRFPVQDDDDRAVIARYTSDPSLVPPERIQKWLDRQRDLKQLQLKDGARFITSKASKRDDPGDRIRRVAQGVPEVFRTDTFIGGTCFGSWCDFDQFLKEDFGLS